MPLAEYAQYSKGSCFERQYPSTAESKTDATATDKSRTAVFAAILRDCPAGVVHRIYLVLLVYSVITLRLHIRQIASTKGNRPTHHILWGHSLQAEYRIGVLAPAVPVRQFFQSVF